MDLILWIFYSISCNKHHVTLCHIRWYWGCHSCQNPREDFWICSAVCWCRLLGCHFVWISSRVCCILMLLYLSRNLSVHEFELLISRSWWTVWDSTVSCSGTLVNFWIDVGLLWIYFFNFIHLSLDGFYCNLCLCFRVVNGALEYLSKDLGIANNTVLQGKFHSIYDDNCNYFTLLFFIRCVQVLCFQTRRCVLSVLCRPWFSLCGTFNFHLMVPSGYLFMQVF